MGLALRIQAGDNMSAKLSRAEALRLAHEVAAWVAYESAIGTFDLIPDRCAATASLCRWHIRPNLSGSCTVAAYVLVCVLRSRGIVSGVLQERKFPHHIVETKCGLLIDPTASQFGYDGPRVVTPRKTRRYAMGIVEWFIVNPNEEHVSSHPSWPSNWLPVIARILRRMGVDAPFNVESEKVAA
jgi:hypothetical protein